MSKSQATVWAGDNYLSFTWDLVRSPAHIQKPRIAHLTSGTDTLLYGKEAGDHVLFDVLTEWGQGWYSVLLELAEPCWLFPHPVCRDLEHGPDVSTCLMLLAKYKIQGEMTPEDHGTPRMQTSVRASALVVSGRKQWALPHIHTSVTRTLPSSTQLNSGAQRACPWARVQPLDQPRDLYRPLARARGLRCSDRKVKGEGATQEMPIVFWADGGGHASKEPLSWKPVSPWAKSSIHEWFH